MSKRSRRSHRNNRPKGRKARQAHTHVVSGDEGLRLVVATGADGEVSLERDLRLVRAALLYADTVEFVSPTAQMLASVSSLASGSPEAIAAFIAVLDDETAAHILGDTDRSTALEGLELIAQVKAMPREQRRKHLPAEVATEVDTATAGMSAALAELDELVVAAGMPELVDAVDSGVLSLNLDLFNGDVDDYMDRFLEVLKGRLEAPGVHLLLDDEMAGIARGMIAEGMVNPSEVGLSRAVRTQAGTRLISHLPAFPDARVADILEARLELHDPLSAYRAGMKSVEGALTAQAFDPELPSEIDEYWRDVIDPSIRRLQADLSKTRVARAAGLNIAESAKWPLVFSTVSFGVAPALDWASISTAAVAGASGTGGFVLSEGIKAIKQTQAARDAARSHDMFYLLQLQDKLA